MSLNDGLRQNYYIISILAGSPLYREKSKFRLQWRKIFQILSMFSVQIHKQSHRGACLHSCLSCQHEYLFIALFLHDPYFPSVLVATKLLGSEESSRRFFFGNE